MTRDYTTLSIDRQGEVDWLTLNRPDSLNALNPVMVDELGDYFRGLEEERAVRVVVLRGSGRAFCAGLDLKDMGGRLDSLDAQGVYAEQRRLSRLIVSMRRCPQPIVCLLHGSASGGGFAMALASDIRLAAPDARMNASFIQVGLTGCDVGVSYHLPRMVGASVAAELMMTGRFLTAARAHALGFVSEIVPEDRLTATAAALVAELLKAAPMALELTKQGLVAAQGVDRLEAAVDVEDRQQAMLANGTEFRGRVRAFLARVASRSSGNQ